LAWLCTTQLVVDPIPLLLSVRASLLGASGIGNFKSSPKGTEPQYREDHVDFDEEGEGKELMRITRTTY